MTEVKHVVVQQVLPVGTILGIIFLVLKLAGVIDWAWWIVLLPFYFWLAVWAAVLVFLAAIIFGAAMIDYFIYIFTKK